MKIKWGKMSVYRHGKRLNAYYYVKEVSPKRLYTIRFQLFDILEKRENYRDSKNISGSHRFSSRGGMSKWNTADIFFK